jgi:trimethylamine--corrinoid protein Co-methyltransferase
MQAGHEKTLTAILPILAGANMIYGFGMLENGLLMSMGQLIADADFIRMFKYVLGGVPVNEDSLAIDVIHEVGIKGEYMSHDHTFDRFRALQSNPQVMDRDSRLLWESAGSKDMPAKSAEIAKKILNEHKPSVLSEEVCSNIREIVVKAEKELINKH